MSTEFGLAPGVRVWTRIAGCALAACAAGAAAPGGPAILVGEAEVRPGGTATLTLRAFGGAGEAVQLAASAEPAPLWLAEAEWTAGPSAAPRLDIELSPPADAAPGVYALTAHATNGAGLTTQAVAAWRVLPRCAGAERDAGGACRECPPDRTPNAAGTGCDPCPPGTRRGAGEAACAGCPAGGAAGACGGAKARSWKRGAASAAGAEAQPALVLSASPAELTESDAAAAVTVTATLSAPAASRLEVPLTFGGTAAAGDYAVSGERRVVVAAGSRSASTTLRVTAVDDVEADGGETIVIGTSLAGRAVTEATLTLREPAGPLLVVHVDGEALAPSSACGGFGRLCLPETSLQAGLTLELRHPPAHAYRKCRVEVGDGPNTARQAQRSRGRRHDYDIFASDPSRQGYHLNSGEDRTLSVSGWWLHVEHDGEEEGPESLTLRGKCGGSPNNRAHRDLRWAPTTVWIADVPWPKLTVERPSGGRVSGAGVDCGSGGGVDCEESYATGSVAELSAAADAHHRFAGWGGACSGSAASCTVELDADRRVSASFEATSHLLTVERPEHGRVTGSGIDCGSGSGSDCAERLAAGATARLSAAADANHRLLGWTGACAGTAGASCAVAMDGAKTAGAEFGAEQRWLWVSPPRRGRIAGPGIDCGSGSSDCTEQYDHGAEVELTATADANHELASWSGACEGAEASCALRMESNLAAGADFALVRRTLTVERPANGHVAAKGVDCGSGTRAACSTSKAHGSVVVAVATADEGYEFESWTGACGAARWPKCQLRLDGDLTVGATFKRAKRTLTVAPPANGHVAGPGIGCGSGSRTDCTEQYDHGTEAELTAVPDPNRRLSAWSGACSASATTTCTVAMDADKTVGAAFVWVKRTLTVERPAHGHVTGAGISCGAGDRTDCTEQYDHGTEVKLTAVPDPNRRLSAWSGACSGSATTTCTVAMDADKAVGAAFVWEKRTLTVARPAHGHVAGAGISCGAGDRTDCTEQYDHGTEVKLTAVPDLNRRLSAWGGACSGSATTTCTVAMDADKTVGATFVWVKRTLTVTRPVHGHVAGAGISCGAGNRTDCTEQYDHGAEVKLTAVPDPNRRLSAWSGACSGSAAACTVAMDADKTVGATFVWVKRTLTVARPAHGHVAGAGISCGSGDRTDCTEQYDHGAEVKLTAVPDLNRRLSAWSGACSGSAPACTVAMDADKTVGATFVWVKRTLTVARPAHGHVAGAGISCGSGDRTDCTEQYDHGTTVTLEAVPDANRKLSAWSGACSASASTTCRLLLDGDKTVGAAFVWVKRTLTVERPVHGHVTGAGINCGSSDEGTDCAKQYDHGTTVELTAEPDTNRELSAWSGACSASASTTCPVLLDGDKTVGAAFVWVKRTLTVERPVHGHVAGAGINCGSSDEGTDCTEQYDHGTTVKLTAAPDANRKLSAWSGACSASATTTCAVLLGGDETVGAAFVWVKRKLTVTRPAHGHVAASGISCGSGGRTDCTEQYDHGTAVKLTATAESGYDFASWGGDCSASASSTCNLRMKEARTASASFAAECAAATVAHCALDRADSGATVSGACASGHNGSCRYACNNGAWSKSVNTCVPNPQCGDPSVASACKPGTRSEPPDDLGIWAVCSSPTSCEAGAPGWSTTRVDGKCGTAASPCAAGTENNRVVGTKETTWRCEGVDGQRTLTCYGTAGAWNWSCTNGTVTRSDCTLGFEENSASCGGLADPATDDNGCRECNAGYGECSGACVANCGPNSTRNAACGCDCKPGYRADGGVCKKLYTLMVKKTDGGSVSSSPAGIACGTDCAEMYVDGKMVTLTATADAGYRFGSWTGCDSSTSAPPTCKVTMKGDKAVDATFVPIHTLTVTKTAGGSVSSSPAGIDCGTDCAEKYDHGTEVTLTATADAGYRFGSWTGCKPSTSAPPTCKVDMTGDKAVHATFVRIHTLTVTKTAGGSVSSSEPGIDCGTDCAEKYDHGTEVTLTATADAGYRFGSWTGCKPSTSAPSTCKVDMTGDKAVHATFVRIHTLTVTKTAGGSVSSSEPGIDCGTDCAEKYDHGTEVTLTATADAGYRFGSWTGCKPSTSAPSTCKVDMTGDKAVHATFVRIHTLTVTKTAGGSVSSSEPGIDCGTDCAEKYDHGTEVTLTATADAGYRFGSWTGCKPSTSAPSTCKVDMTGDKAVHATFVRIHTLTVTKTAGGSVSSSEPGIDCGTDCAEKYDRGTEVTLTATADAGYRFGSWTGCKPSTSAPSTCKVDMTGGKAVHATFVRIHTLTVTRPTHGHVTGTGISCGSGNRTDCTEQYDHGTKATLTASWISTTHVLTWSGCDIKDQTALTCNVTMSADKTVAATYKLSCPAGCESATCGTTEVCKCARACPQSYARHGNCMATQARTCTGDTDGCGRSVRYTRCTTGKDRPELANRPAETCQYEERDRSILGCAHRQRTCRATITHMGCVFSPGTDEPGPIGFGDDEEWSEHAHGYILPTFECGAKANTCDVAFDDETVTTDDYGVAAKDDAGTEWLWECRSDNGTVRQCSLPKSGG